MTSQLIIGAAHQRSAGSLARKERRHAPHRRPGGGLTFITTIIWFKPFEIGWLAETPSRLPCAGVGLRNGRIVTWEQRTCLRNYVQACPPLERRALHTKRGHKKSFRDTAMVRGAKKPARFMPWAFVATTGTPTHAAQIIRVIHITLPVFYSVAS